jgi:O-antigen/teichoic acid export membrane protein
MPVSSVALSSFSKLRERMENLRRAYLRLTQFLSILSLPLVFGLGAVADILVPHLLGEKWLPSVFMLQLLGFLMLSGTINWFFAPLMVAVGAADVVLKQAISQAFLAALLIGIGAHWGLHGVVIAHILRSNLICLYNLYAMSKVAGLRPLSVLTVLLPPSVACSIMMGVVLITKDILSSKASSAELLALLVVTGAVAYVATLLTGEALGFWRGYLSGAVQSLAGAVRKRPSISTRDDL